jgi:tRNA G18 (ribose-2'-O)-methylase SpoU
MPRSVGDGHRNERCTSRTLLGGAGAAGWIAHATARAALPITSAGTHGTQAPGRSASTPSLALGDNYGSCGVLLDDPLDPRVREYAHLRASTLRLRAEGPEGARHGVFIAEGELVIERALRLGYRMRSLLLLEQRLERFRRLAPEGVPVYAASGELMRSITGFAVHRGVLASFDRRPQAGVADVVRDARRVVVLEDVNNHTNVGAIVRSASALGVDALLLDPSSCDPLYRRSLRISMGEALSLPHARTEALPAGLAPLRAAGFALVALTPAEDALDIAEVAAAGHERLALLLGSEGPGLSRPVLDEADVRVRIPLSAGVDSLNVAAAAAIALYALRTPVV